MRQKKYPVLEWVVLLGLSVGAVAASEVIGLSQVWEDGVVYTIVLFAVILTTLSPAWRLKSFWESLALIFTGHTLVLLVVLHELSPRRHGIPMLLLIPIGTIESVFIAAILWKRMKASRSSAASGHMPD